MQASEDLQQQILIVEDESLIAADLARRIARLGYPARRSRNPEKRRWRVRGRPASTWC